MLFVPAEFGKSLSATFASVLEIANRHAYFIPLVVADLQLFAEYVTCKLYTEHLSGALGDHIFVTIKYIKRMKHWNEGLLKTFVLFSK
jgi:hypothetical protein